MCTVPSDSRHSSIPSQTRVDTSEETASCVNSDAWRTLHARHVRQQLSPCLPRCWSYGRKRLYSSCPCLPFIIFWTQTYQIRKLLNSHLFAQMFLGSRNLSVDQIISQSLGSQWNKWTRLNTGHWIQSTHVTGLTGATDDVGLHRKHDTFAALSDKE